MNHRARQLEASEPLYLQIADRLESEIVRRRPGDEVNSEHELAERFETSRLTARAALEELERRSLVQRSRGRRTLVRRRIDYGVGPDTPPSWSETVRRGGGVPRSVTEELRLRRPPLWVRAQLALTGDPYALHLVRLRYVDEEVASLAESWLAPDLVPGLASAMGPEGSLHETLRDTYRLEPYRATSRAEMVVAPAPVARKLGVGGRPMVFRLEGRTDSERYARPIQVTQSWLRADVFRVIFDMGERRDG
jgi:DNA-binding GntR family transcriptional regulator